jgi:hypothetical protein
MEPQIWGPRECPANQHFSQANSSHPSCLCVLAADVWDSKRDLESSTNLIPLKVDAENNGLFAGTSLDGERRTRTADTTIFSEAERGR